MNTQFHRILVPIAFGLLLYGGTAANGQDRSDGWPLDRCITEARTTSGRLAASALQAEAADRDADRSRAERLPSLAVSGKFDYVNKVMKLNLPATPLFSLPDISFGDGKTYDMAVALQAPLFTGGALAQREKATRDQAKAAHEDHAADSLGIVHEVRTAYFQAVAAESMVRTAKQGVDRLARHLKDIEIAQQVGMAGEEANVTIQARLREAESGLLGAQAQARAARFNLGRLVGRPNEEIHPDSGLEASLLANRPDSTAIESRPDVAALDARIAGGERYLSAAKGAYWPTLAAQMAYHYGKPGINAIQNDWMDYTTAGVRLSWTLFDWGARGDNVQKARVSKRALEEVKRDLVTAYRTRYATAKSRLEAATAQRDKSRERVSLEQQKLELVHGRYSQGQAAETEYLDAMDDVTSAEAALVVATANVRLAETDILFILGR